MFPRLRRILALSAVLFGLGCSTPSAELIGGDLALRAAQEGVRVLQGTTSLQLGVRAVGRVDHPGGASLGAWSEGARLERDLGGGARLWWTPAEAAAGLEFGVDLASRPPGEGPLRIELSVEGARVEVAHDAESARLRTGPSTVHVSSLRAWDSEGTELYARFLSDGPGQLVLYVEDQDAVYPIVVDPILSSVASTLSGTPS